MRDKIHGMLLGVAIGDALGIPAESWTNAQVLEAYPFGLTKYEKPDGHRWYDGELAGSTSDDTALTLATLQGLIDAKDFTLESQANALVAAMKKAEAARGDKTEGSGVPGWGHSTVEAIRRLGNNVPYQESGKSNIPGRGCGNGTVIKCSPLAAYKAWKKRQAKQKFNMMVVDYSAMTHYTRPTAIASVVHVHTLHHLLTTPPDKFTFSDLFSIWSRLKGNTANITRNWGNGIEFWSVEHLEPTPENMWVELDKVVESHKKHWSIDDIYNEFEGGTCYINHSFPFSYAHFAMNPYSIDTLYRVASAGGDTDSNASMVGAMLGALHGVRIFPQHLLDGLVDQEAIELKIEEFLDVFKF